MQNLVSIVSQMGPNNPNRPMGFHMFQGYTPFYIMLGMFFVAIAFMLYYFPWLEKVKTSKDIHEIVEMSDLKVSEKNHSHSLDVALRLLNDDERRVIMAILEAGGTMLQKEISSELDISRVKTHRILVRLIQRGAVTAQKYYNTNKITIAKWLRD